MTSKSRSTTQTIAFDAAPQTTHRASESYSDNLMDDLFGDVDRILDGDLSACMTLIKPQRQTAATGTKTVQLPANFSPKSAADLYQATMTASKAQAYASNKAASQQIVNPAVYHQTTHQSLAGQSLASQSATARKPSGYSRGGRPMTAFRATAAQSGNFQSTVIQSPGTTIDVQTSSQHATNDIYSQTALPDLTLPELDADTGSPQPSPTIFEPKTKQQPVSVPFLLIGAAGISVASTVGLWALGNAAPNGSLFAFNTEASAAELPSSEADFLVYLQKSLETISANQAQAGQTLAVLPVAAPAPALPTTVPNVNAAPTAGALPNLPGANLPEAATTPNVIERVFVPVYQKAQANTQVATAPANSPLPNVAVPNSAAQRPTVPVPAPVAAAADLPPGAPASPTASVPMVPGNTASLPALPAPTEIAVAPTNSAVNALTDVTPDSEQVLVGVLNLGSRSAALFDVNGNSQRAYVGDRIGTSEWSLVSVNGQDVVIRRDGEVRSVYIGQRF
ncbi:MAG: hypothetical protein ACFB16_20760 [Phormidesmis sp.]